MPIKTLIVVYKDAEGNVQREETTPDQIVDYCLDTGALPPWYDPELTSAQWFTDPDAAAYYILALG